MYRVIWLRRARETLANYWVHADSSAREAITKASHALDQRLQSDPWSGSESRVGDTRVTFEAPLSVFYLVDDEEMVVVVQQIRVFERRNGQ